MVRAMLRKGQDKERQALGEVILEEMQAERVAGQAFRTSILLVHGCMQIRMKQSIPQEMELGVGTSGWSSHCYSGCEMVHPLSGASEGISWGTSDPPG
jgi:hypothetical protein